VRFGPIYEFIWASGVGPRVAEPALLLIDPYPWSAPLEDVRLNAREDAGGHSETAPGWWNHDPRSMPAGAAGHG
jgi:hypothetical protein